MKQFKEKDLELKKVIIDEIPGLTAPRLISGQQTT